MLTNVRAQGDHSDILVYTYKNKKTCEKGSFFLVSQRKHLGVKKCHFQENGGGFVRIYSNSADSNHRRVNLRQNPTKSFKGGVAPGC